jgi:hypothetical protein
MVLVHERTALSLIALITTHVLIVVIISRVASSECQFTVPVSAAAPGSKFSVSSLSGSGGV